MKKKAHPKENTTLKILRELHVAYKAFLDSPTTKNIELFIQLSSMYTESWISDASNENITPKISSEDLYKDHFTESSPEIKDLEEPLSPMDTFYKTGERPTSDLENSLDKIWLLKEKMRGEIPTSFKPPKKFKIGPLIRKHEVGRASGQSNLMKLITSSVYCPPLKELDGKDLHYVEHSFRGVRYHEDRDKFYNRRWYVESDTIDSKGETSPKEPWDVVREEFTQLAEEANDLKLFNKDLDDERVIKGEVISSDDLTLADRIKYFNEITFPDEREELMNRDYHFVIYESFYCKKPDQYLSASTKDGNNPKWRDVCIFNPDFITFRSLTTDKTFVPRIPIPGNQYWVMNNDMPNISNQAMKVFLKYTHPRMKINEIENRSVKESFRRNK